MEFRKTFLASAVLVGLGGFASNAGAGWIGGFEGYNVFEHPCPSCDGTVSFAVWDNSMGGNWISDLSLTGLVKTAALGNSAVSTGLEQYVYFYQVTNTNPGDPSRDGDLQEFSVLGEWSTGGYLQDTSFANRSTATTTIDVQNSPHPTPDNDNLTSMGGFFTDVAGLAPDQIVIGGGDVALPEGGQISGDIGQVTWLFGNFLSDNNSATDGGGNSDYSNVLFFTAPKPPTWGMGETEGSGTGAAGNVPTPVPLPNGLLLMAAGLGIAGMARKARRA